MDAERFPERETTRAIIGAFFPVHTELGFGFLESVYRRALAHELTKLGLGVEVESSIDVWYDGIQVGHFRADLLAERRVIVEVKASVALVDADRKQLLNYLRATDVEVGLLLHFGPKASVKRLIFANARKSGRARHC
jgi:GxxExxY protein